MDRRTDTPSVCVCFPGGFETTSDNDLTHKVQRAIACEFASINLFPHIYVNGLLGKRKHPGL